MPLAVGGEGSGTRAKGSYPSGTGVTRCSNESLRWRAECSFGFVVRSRHDQRFLVGLPHRLRHDEREELLRQHHQHRLAVLQPPYWPRVRRSTFSSCLLTLLFCPNREGLRNLLARHAAQLPLQVLNLALRRVEFLIGNLQLSLQRYQHTAKPVERNTPREEISFD